MPARNEALIPSAQSAASTGRAGAGTSTTAAPRTTTTSSQPPPSSAKTAERSHLPPSARTFGIPNRVPAPAARTTPAARSAMPPVSGRNAALTSALLKSASKIDQRQQLSVGSNQVEFPAAGYVIDVQAHICRYLHRWALRIQGLHF